MPNPDERTPDPSPKDGVSTRPPRARPRPTASLITATISAHGGIATTAQLAAAGVCRNAVTLRVRDGRLLQEFHGVFHLPGVPLPEDLRRRAAVLSCGDGAMLDLWSAAVAWELVTFQTAPDSLIHVAVDDRVG